ncbi:hypothetical protein EG329_008235 [Mollisiaceae sp. DMI_Dod_QoI]|nr:hypothetical protein EG329_008235 [Helotiales sp. DMI_Dod_QoI]
MEGSDTVLSCMDRRDEEQGIAAKVNVCRAGVAIYETDGAQTGRLVVIQKWPSSSEVVSKVPTRVAYTAGEIGIHSWGLGCPELGEIGRGVAIKDMFKFFLNEHFVKGKFPAIPHQAPKIENVRMWYEDFLTALYHHIVSQLREIENIDLKLSHIEFIFSIPTAWLDNDQVLQEFRKLVDRAGFSKIGDVIMRLTEGEAAAVFTAKRLEDRFQFQEGEAFMVCDAGGGTTDMCVLRVKRVQEEMVELENLDSPKAISIGSVNIDDLFEVRAEAQLRRLGFIDPEQIRLLTDQITRGGFQGLKTRFGTDLVEKIAIMSLPVPNSDDRVDLSRDELKNMFDVQVEKIIELIDNEIAYLKRDKIKLGHLFLAGGLGSSKYVQDQIARHCKDLRVLFAPEPENLRLAVCKGLVIDRLQHFSEHIPVIIRNTNASYGILCRELRSKKHSGQPKEKSLVDNRTYARRQIEWLAFRDQEPARGERVPIRGRYSLILDATAKIGDNWGFSVVRSSLEKEKLPTFLGRQGGAEVICHVFGGIGTDFTNSARIRRRVLSLRQYPQVDCELSAIIEVGKIEFAIKLIGDEDAPPQPLEVQWNVDRRMNGDEMDGLIRSM